MSGWAVAPIVRISAVSECGVEGCAGALHVACAGDEANRVQREAEEAGGVACAQGALNPGLPDEVAPHLSG